jgi:hypothetical protein
MLPGTAAIDSPRYVFPEACFNIRSLKCCSFARRPQCHNRRYAYRHADSDSGYG